MKYIALIPSYEPTDKLIKIVSDLKELNKFDIVVVNDGSDKKYDKYFDKIKKDVTYLSYETNHGKGYALKYAFKYIQDNYDECIIATLDSDGQHTAKDTLNLCNIVNKSDDNVLLLGKRLRDKNIPFKSRFGNSLTRFIYRISTGIDVYDTQTGLRVFKNNLLPFMIDVEGNRFEYEMNMLLDAPKNKIDIKEEVIETIYEDGNSGTHFHPIKDSFRIYKQLLKQFFKFIIASFSSFLVDYGCFALFFMFMDKIYANILARVISSIFNFTLNRNIVFKDKGNVFIAVLKYYLLAAFILLCNTLLLMLLSKVLPVLLAKVIVEIILFTISYFVQKRFIF